jgi:hypothetical protein
MVAQRDEGDLVAGDFDGVPGRHAHIALDIQRLGDHHADHEHADAEVRQDMPTISAVKRRPAGAWRHAADDEGQRAEHDPHRRRSPGRAGPAGHAEEDPGQRASHGGQCQRRAQRHQHARAESPFQRVSGPNGISRTSGAISTVNIRLK